MIYNGGKKGESKTVRHPDLIGVVLDHVRGPIIWNAELLVL